MGYCAGLHGANTPMGSVLNKKNLLFHDSCVSRRESHTLTEVRRKMRIAIIDDERFVRRILERGLKRDEHIVDTFEGGKEFLSHYTAGAEYDILLLDIVMPGMTGVAVYEVLRDTARPMPAVIFISAYDFTGELKHLIDNSSVWYLAKPFTLEELRTGIEKASIFVEQQRQCQSQEMLHLKECTLLREPSRDCIPLR